MRIRNGDIKVECINYVPCLSQNIHFPRIYMYIIMASGFFLKQNLRLKIFFTFFLSRDEHYSPSQICMHGRAYFSCYNTQHTISETAQYLF